MNYLNLRHNQITCGDRMEEESLISRLWRNKLVGGCLLYHKNVLTQLKTSSIYAVPISQ